MSGNLFPIKLEHLFHELRNAPSSPVVGAPSVFEKSLHHAKVLMKTNHPDDGLERIILCSPEVQQAVRRATGEKSFRIRVAVPPASDFGYITALASQAKLEVYDEKGDLLQTPVKLTELPDDLANAMQVELFHELLRAHGSSIPLL